MKLTLLALCGAVLLGACAKSPDAIVAASMGNAYSGTTCAQARGDLLVEQQTLAQLSSQQEGAVVGDAIGVFLLAVPVSSLTGGNKEGLIATSKGKINALEARLSNC